MVLFFAGSFNPFTRGHAAIVGRALAVAERVIIGLGVNADKPHSADQAAAEMARLKELYAAQPAVEIVTYSGLTAPAAKERGADMLLRGVRSGADFSYEADMARANRALFGIDTMLLIADDAASWVSSSLVRDLRHHGCDPAIINSLLPEQ